MDTTDRKRAEGALKQSELQLRQSQKMEAVGRLAGAVAYDFNNLLTAINGYSELLSKSLGNGHPIQETVHENRRAGERAASLTRQLLIFSRRQVPASRFLDLAINARDAMPTGGSLTIRTANVRLGPGHAGALFPVRPGRYVRLTVVDTGIGMDEDIKSHLFEPFFTTKPAGQGTGLGLSTVYDIVKGAGGNLSVTSGQGEGTVFTVSLPAASAPTASEQESDAETVAGPAHVAEAKRETVLLVEDEDMVRRLIAQALLSHDYNVVEAASGAEAMAAVESHVGVIDLLLTDVVMKGMSGRELSERMLARKPGLKVIYVRKH